MMDGHISPRYIYSIAIAFARPSREADAHRTHAIYFIAAFQVKRAFIDDVVPPLLMISFPSIIWRQYRRTRLLDNGSAFRSNTYF